MCKCDVIRFVVEATVKIKAAKPLLKMATVRTYREDAVLAGMNDVSVAVERRGQLWRH